MGEEESKTSKKRVVESLGWLTESSIMPRKHRAIEGVGASSILELKAQLYKSQEESKRNPKEPIHSADHNYAQHLEVHRAKQKISANDAFSHKNSGVDARAAKYVNSLNYTLISVVKLLLIGIYCWCAGAVGLSSASESVVLFVNEHDFRDKLELKAVKDGSASYAALERKAKLYNKLVRGEISDEEDEEKYCVDFFRKGLEQDESQMPQGTENSMVQAQDVDGDDLLLNNTKPAGVGRTSATVDRSQHKHFVMEVHEEANQAREKVSELKMRRQEQAAARREKLKQAYLRKQLEKLKASKAEQT
ncbi:hypothetical protein DH2020_042173 [Rehmannia glutinosa]|uniref:Uncharacterized protein n=1 Tax=Rehmannia glutinosa TaxID=99300 RepID=A0ABR0UN32_REHGL